MQKNSLNQNKVEPSRVFLLPCESYDEDKIYSLMKDALSQMAPLFQLLGDKDRHILLKPNLLKKSSVDQAVITHPAVMGAFARILKEKGYEHVMAADSCGTGSVESSIRGTGMEEALNQYGVTIQDYSCAVKTEFPQGQQAREFLLGKEVAKADAVISLSKMKTHALERITGAVKNSYGFIYGKNKALGHTKYPNAESFARMLVDLNLCVAPKLYIMDGIMAMEGNGPGSGDPVPMNVVLISEDPVALDSVFARLVFLDPEDVPTNDQGRKMGLGTWKEEEIEVLLPGGRKLSMEEMQGTYGNPHFNVDRKKVRSNQWTKLALAAKLVQKRPVIDEDKCIHCGICTQSCPVPEKAVAFINGTDKPPVYDYHKCIRCFCCQEMCPQKAIRAVRGPLWKKK